MPKVHSHYENLKVPRDATAEAIRNAYRTLSQKHHPDRNPDAKDATRIMMVINTAYETLSDPVKRRRHDDWIASAEGRAQRSASAGGTSSRRRSHSTEGSRRSTHRSTRAAAGSQSRPLTAHLWRHRFRYALGVMLLVAAVMLLMPAPPPTADSSPFGPKTAFDPKFYPAYQVEPKPPPEPEEPAPADTGAKPGPGGTPIAVPPRAVAPGPRQAQLPANEALVYRRPATAPNGQPWPKEPAYVRGYQMLRADGLSTVTLDNSRNGADVFAKLVYLEAGQSVPARVVYLPAFKQMALTNVNPGRYDLRFRDLNSGELTRSTPFILKESPKVGSVEASSFTIVITNARSGNLHMHGLSENEF